MASQAQCFYCFETLASSFKDEEPPSLAAIDDLWLQYNQAKQLAAVIDKTAVAEDNDDNTETNDEETKTSEDMRPHAVKLPSISRLQQQNSSSDSSSISTTPSSLSANSSHSALSKSTTVTTPGEYQGSHRSKESYPLFVTWNLISKHGHKSLRGCIGTFEEQELSFGLKTYALTSAFDDTRFSPIPSSQMPSLSCSLTLLSDFEPCTDAMDWELGLHGLRISFIHRSRRYGATYLPDVAVEQGWTKEETVESLMRKAGWDGNSSGGVARRLLRGSSAAVSGGSSSSSGKPWDQVSDFRATRYQGLQASASYTEWQEWRKWVQADEARLAMLRS
ncbi:AMMECR1 domain-containing protein [Talaromyces proteolyticus]|uniref:AMMECR1 domain-containing protein n=1 Tax=Talaromyces proteolyticus TaxID=1131652 RepID=A0AAD4KLP7_9EURO|nr:AMMECR1 domain-containing protein [Talaromyces proteolyticus]KAH8693012.1 AMMECR1 domain-containing protein [Talaromyces proteolyticus]